jgi:hypothetical protein
MIRFFHLGSLACELDACFGTLIDPLTAALL